MKASFLQGSDLFLVALCLMTCQPVFAQHVISGFAYELQSGQPLEGVRVHIKNRQGLEIGTIPAVYSNDKGYFEVTGVRSNDYRLEARTPSKPPMAPLHCACSRTRI